MPGPPPKDPLLRQRRNKSATSKTLAPTGKRRRRAPSLPMRGEDKKWNEHTLAWWRDVWHSPMAAEFVDADVHALFRLAILVDLFWTEPSKELAAEIRLEQQAFGLTPIDRRRLQWSIEEEEVRKRPAARPAPAPESGTEPGDDPRKILQMVAAR